jgi:hypothetical protein
MLAIAGVILVAVGATVTWSITRDGGKAAGPASDFTNGIGIKFVAIPPGSFIRGVPMTKCTGAMMRSNTTFGCSPAFA